MSAVLGLIACIIAPAVLVIGFYIWDKTWTGSALFLNAWKGTFAATVFILIIAVHALVAQEHLYPPEAGGEVIGWLWLSSFLGIVIGDTFWLMALSRLGALHVILIDSIKPFLAAGLAATFLDEPFDPLILVGILITTVGVLLVATDDLIRTDSEQADGDASDGEEKHTEQALDIHCKNSTIVSIDMCAASVGEQPPATSAQVETTKAVAEADADKIDDPPPTVSGCRGRALGYAFAALNCTFDVVGAILTKAYAEDLTTWHINLVRFGGAGLQIFGLIGFVLAASKLRHTAPPDWSLPPKIGRKGWAVMVAGTLLATVATPALTQYGLFQIDVAIYTTLISLGPVWSLPVGVVAKGQRLTIRSCIGSLMAAGGIIPLAMSIQD